MRLASMMENLEKFEVDYGSLQKEIENQLRIAKLQVQSADCHSCWGKYVFWVISRFGFGKISTRFQIWDWKNNLNHIPTLPRADAKVFFSHGTLRYAGSMGSCVSTDIFDRGAHVLYDIWHVYFCTCGNVPKISATGIKYAFPTPMEYALWTPQP